MDKGKSQKIINKEERTFKARSKKADGARAKQCSHHFSGVQIITMTSMQSEKSHSTMSNGKYSLGPILFHLLNRIVYSMNKRLVCEHHSRRINIFELTFVR